MVALSVPLIRKEKTFPKTHATTVFCLTEWYYVTWPPLAAKDVGKLNVSLFSDQQKLGKEGVGNSYWNS